MKKKLGLVHTSATLVPVFAQLCKSKIPDVEVFNIADDSLIRDVIAGGKLTPGIARRVAAHITSAESAGADFILVTCSSIGPSVEAAAPFVGVPVMRVDQPMADEAVRAGGSIGVIATLPTTLAPTTDLIRRRSALANSDVELIPHLCEGAFDALMGGDAKKHDEMVAGALRSLSSRCKVIVLAQASMARVVEQLSPEDRHVPILASPPIAVDYLARTL